MNKLVRGGIILSIVSLCVVFIYAQTQTEETTDLANSSQVQFSDIETETVEANNLEVVNNNQNKVQNNNNKVKETNTNSTVEQDDQQKEGNSKLTKTGSSRAIGGIKKGKFVATAYCLRGKTANGTSVRKGIIAADPRVLRLGTRVNLGAGAHSGNYVVTDTGGKIKGNKIDIWMASCAEARRFGRRTVDLSVLN